MRRTGLLRGAVVLGLAGLAQIAVHGEHAKACGWDGPYIFNDTITFDPTLLASTESNLAYDPYTDGYGEYCFACGSPAAVDDWYGYLKATGITRAEVETLLAKATASDFTALAQRLVPPATPPKQAPKLAAELAKLPFLANPSNKPLLAGAFTELALARRVEHYTTYDPAEDTKDPGRPSAALQKQATDGQAAAGSDAFLVQRYAFLGVRIRFYEDDYAGVIKFVDATSALTAPSLDLKWRTRWYYAGALKQTKKLALANLELAHMSAEYPPLAGMASHDFRPTEDAEWRATLKAAKTPHDQALVWRLVGIQHDGLGAVAEIQKLEPSSPTIPLLLVRELARDESMAGQFWGPEGQAPTGDEKAALAKLEKLAAVSAAAPTADRRAIAELVIAHINAIRGNVAATKQHAAAAIALAPRDAHVAAQAHASIALVLVRQYKVSPAAEAELGSEYVKTTGGGVALDFALHSALSKLYLKAGKRVEAELLAEGYEPDNEYRDPVHEADANGAWDAAFLLQLIDRVENPKTDWDRFLIASSYSSVQLHRELALRYVAEGKFTEASTQFATYKIPPQELVTTPYVLHVKDCWDCDTIKFKSNDIGIIHELVALDATVKGGGKGAAAAALKIGTALLNFTYLGNTTWMYLNSHQRGYDATEAGVYAKLAFDLAKNPEQKAAAAWLGAKADVGTQIAAIRAKQSVDDRYNPIETVSKTWYPKLKKLQATKYAQEVLKECGWYSDWATAHP